MPQTFAIQSVAVPLMWKDYFTSSAPQFDTITTGQLLDRIVSLGATDVRLITSFGQQTGVSGNVITPFETQSVESLKVFTDAAHARGLTISVTPLVHMTGVIAGDSTGVSHPTPSDPAAWMASFAQGVLEQARIAEAIGAVRFAVLSDVEQAVFQAHPELVPAMVSLIGQVRQVFHGEITSVLWTPDGSLASVVPSQIVDALDIIGLGMFPLVTQKLNPTLAELEAGWRSDVDGADIVANLARLAESTGKQIWFSDFAQSSYDGWLNGSVNKFAANSNFVVDNSEQTLGFQAAFEILAKYGYGWFEGLSIQNISRITNDHALTAPYISSAIGENFWGKPGEQVIRDWFTGATTLPTVEVQGSNYGEDVRGGFGPSILRAGQGGQAITGGPAADTIHSANPAHNVAAHELKLKLNGVAVNGEMPTFAIRVNGQFIPVDYAVTSANGAGMTLTVPLFTSGAITSVEVVSTNWVFLGFGADQNRILKIQAITLDGVNLAATNPVYHIDNGSLAAFNGDINRGGYVTYNTSGLTLAATGHVNLAANTSIDGGAGTDTVVYDGAAVAFTLTRTAAGWTVLKPGGGAGEGIDTLSNVEILRFSDKALLVGGNLDASATSVAQSIDLAAGHVSSVILGGLFTSLTSVADGGEAHGGAGADTLRGGALASRLFGGAGGDTITGLGGRDYLRGEEGNDVIVGGDGFDDTHGNMGDDTVSGGAGDDWVVGGKDNDRLSGDEGDDVVYGNLGNDTQFGGAGVDWVRGGQGDDILDAGAGNDWISGDKGSDTITGGAGADLFHTHGEAGIDRVLDFNRAEGDVVNLLAGTQYTVAQVGADTVISMTGGGPMTLVGVQMSSLTTGWIFGA